MLVITLYTAGPTMWNEIKYRWEVFRITWLRPSAFINRFRWDISDPIKAVLYKKGFIRNKPLRMEVEELNRELGMGDE